MADKSQGRSPKKPTMTIKERRAAKRDKAAEAGETIPRRKRPDRS
ncbi:MULTISPECIES: hypothetical protein [Mycolicibacterium]|nr:MULTISPECIES: hypothetical protein [Mycolicibacterium]MCW1820332.1 hypothetical protein [Mycolicibacterium senegalense]